MNLVETAELTKKILKGIAATLVLYFIFLGIKAPIKASWVALFPPKNQPTVAFGLVDPLQLTQVPIVGNNPEYVLNTADGSLPEDLETVMKIYKYKPVRYSYSAGANAQRDASILGYTDNMRVSELSELTLKWEDVFYGGKLAIDLNKNTLELVTPLASKGSLFPAGKLNKVLVIEVAQELFTRMDRFTDPLYKKASLKDIKVYFGKFTARGAIEANSILEAQIARVDIFRSVEDYPILGPNPTHALLQVFLRTPEADGRNRQLNFPLVKAYHWEIDTTQQATYPLLPIAQAWEQISTNGGVISNVTPKGQSPFLGVPITRVDKILVNNIYLAYFDNKEPQTFLQPIYVFEGNYTAATGGSGNITLYYPAVSGEYVRPLPTAEPTTPQQ